MGIEREFEIKFVKRKNNLMFGFNVDILVRTKTAIMTLVFII